MPLLTGTIIDVVARRIFPGKLQIEEGKIASIEETPEASSPHFIIPGFVDAHVHVESSMLIPSEFARLAVCHGTVATISDPHEIANVLGIPGIEFMLENAAQVPFKFCFGAPSCVPATAFETAGATIDAQDIEQLINREDIGYLAEVMNFPGVLAEDPDLLQKIKVTLDAGKVVDGHAPGLRGESASNYAAAGITTDHECFTREEALDKIHCGMKILIREGSAAKNFDALISLLDEFPDQIMFCSDDKHPNDLVRGHINHLALRAIKWGCDPMNVLRACSHNVIRHYNLGVGMLQPNDPADFCVVEDLESFNVVETWIDGQPVAQNGFSLLKSLQPSPINHFEAEAISESALQLRAPSPTTPQEVNVIEVANGQLVTQRRSFTLHPQNGQLLSDPTQDVLKIVVLNRYSPDSPPAIGFVHNFGLQQGAIASSVAHDSHNIIAVGVSDTDISQAINTLIASQGGVALADRDSTRVLPLPVAGLMTHADGYETAQRYEELDTQAKALGSQLDSPYMTLSFCALLVIPQLKLSDLGLFDGTTFAFVDLFAAPQDSD